MRVCLKFEFGVNVISSLSFSFSYHALTISLTFVQQIISMTETNEQTKKKNSCQTHEYAISVE